VRSVAANPLRSLLNICWEPDVGPPRLWQVAKRGSIVASRNYFARQVATLLKLAKTTSDPKVVIALVDKASELKSQADEALPTPDLSPLPPDVEYPT
jgi:hypothetical protein